MWRFTGFIHLAFLSLAFPAHCWADSPRTELKKENSPLLSLPLYMYDDTPYLQVRVNDSAPVWFVVDSGASACVVDKEYCRTLGIPLKGHRKGTGAGAGEVDFFFIENVRFALPGLTFKTDQAYAIDLSGISTPKDKKLRGVLGYDFFLRYIVALDYTRSSMAIYDPQNFAYRGPGESLPLVFKKKVPFVKGTIRVPGHAPVADREWLVDTGSSDPLNDDLLAESTGEKKQVTGGRGLGHEFQIWQATADEVQLGQFRFPKVTGYSGAMKIGGGLLRQFTVIFDYPAKRMILERQGK
jgi:hypothetical protein